MKQRVEVQKLEIEKLKTLLAQANANTAAKLSEKHEELTMYYLSNQSKLDNELQQVRLENIRLENLLEKLGEQRRKEQEELVKQHAVQLQNQETDFAVQYNNLSQHLHEEYQSQVSEELKRRDHAHQEHISKLLERIESLESSLVDNSDDFRPATDDSLRNKYQAIKLTIETISFNLGAITFLPGTRLDPGRFMEREGEAVYLLQSIIWERLQEGFFSLPFGLGSLGPGEGKKRLLEMYVAYRRLAGVELPGAVPAQLIEQECIQVFRSDREANKWRSSTFQTIGTAVVSKKGTPASEIEKDTQFPFFKNRQQVLNSVKAVLNDVCVGVSQDMEEKVIDLVRLAGELALEFGVQRAELGFESPPRDSSIQIGRGFVDCVDDDKCKDQFKTVALAVSPKFYKTGDGRHDLTTTKLISQGTIFSARL
ncbi:hypothetical protein QBC38DRAFT_367931 [Podospora fimiseda]|uniref:Uncharacterized protein n=1 Tax=Podospora fimiseda TaxID=252190 RepID=A0AAN7GWH1_9PEZI|nr:hypothetical protein QBC38DRAFT_367931 [Podospora fimiseda]